MDREELKGYLERGLSLVEIGALVNRDPSTVGYWVKKHGLIANGREKYAPRGGLSRGELAPLVEAGHTLQEMATILDRSVSTVCHWLAKHGLRTDSRCGPKPMVHHEVVRRAVEEGKRTVVGVCRHHGEGTFVIDNRGSARCRQCRMEGVSNRRRKVKATLIEEAGGRCIRCGYDRFVGALHFHHVDPGSKSFGIAQKGHTIGIDRLRAEAGKCLVLCANCHAEVEAGFTEP